MTRLPLALLLAGSLLVPATALAQRASLAERVASLEQQAASNQGNVDLLNQITALRSDVQALRAQLEELQHQNEQLRSSSHDQYLDLDGRVSRLEGGAAPAPAAAPAPNPPATVLRDTAPAVHGDAGTLAQGADERSSYDAAFNTLKSGSYAESARQFQDFLQRYPAGAYAPNALYWLGESFYATQNYALAQQQFQALLDRYPTHDKAAGALLKIGLSQYGLKQLDAAQATLAQVIKRYPGTDAARTADDRLRAIQLQQAR
ncbi:tol-pal system protein YbgF [Cognatiluteimonas profundi]|uniref:tol-pal system protein YbgF n=1 Tax=Cognatiluteimonas profundi TaxID=2594501 RepID=UPI0018EF069E|nr:tol-pal system protein YbgF [Lysobacter profundi]